MPDKVQIADLVGKPFEWGGTGNPGYDCGSLAVEISKRVHAAGLGCELPQWESIEDVILRCRYINHQKQHFIRLERAQPWCLVTFYKCLRDGAEHVGTILPNCFQFIHVISDPKAKVRIERLDHPYWSKHIDGFWQYNITDQR